MISFQFSYTCQQGRWDIGRTGLRHSRWPGWRKCANPRWREPPCRFVTRCSKPQTDKALRLVMARRAATVPVPVKKMINCDDHSTDEKMVKVQFSSVHFRTHLSCPVLFLCVILLLLCIVAPQVQLFERDNKVF